MAIISNAILGLLRLESPWPQAFRVSLTFILVISAAHTFAGTAATTRAAKQLDGALDIRQAPTKGDWQVFLQSPEAQRDRLWIDQIRQGRHLKDWAWGWRLGWVRACGDSKQRICTAVMAEALGDKALVVRAEAVTRLGRLYEDTGSESTINLLETAYKNPRNSRNGHPLMVQNRILFALSRIGGAKAKAVAARLAKNHTDSQKYWSRLEQTGQPKKG